MTAGVVEAAVTLPPRVCSSFCRVDNPMWWWTHAHERGNDLAVRDTSIEKLARDKWHLLVGEAGGGGGGEGVGLDVPKRR
jgi:hypothetical protein